VTAAVVELSRLTKSFGELVAVDDVSAVAVPGQVRAQSVLGQRAKSRNVDVTAARIHR
jgi:ABC-type branched-subunit amino acid transport system ATPase component